jgi:hypothetical protein
MVDVRMKILCQRNAVLLTLLLASVSAAQDSTLKPATDAAAQWLALIDAGQYSQSWQQASPLFQQKVPLAKWQADLSRIRTRLGRLGSRQLKSADVKSETAGTAAGKYVVIQYRTQFAVAGPVIETVKPVLDVSGHWKVADYSITPTT